MRPCRASVASSLKAVGPTSPLFLCCDERQPALGILPLVQVPRRLGQHHLQCRPDMRFQEMATHCGAVGAADDNVGMQRRLAVGPKGYVAKEGNNLDLLGDGNSR